MPEWSDEKVWEDAKQAFKKSYGHLPKEDKDYAITMTIYKNMGGKMKKESWKESLNKMYEATQLLKKSATATVDRTFRERELKSLLKIIGWKDPNNQIIRIDLKAEVFYKKEASKPVQPQPPVQPKEQRPEEIL